MNIAIRFEDELTVEILLKEINKGRVSNAILKEIIKKTFVDASACYSILKNEKFAQCHIEILLLMKSPDSKKETMA